MKNFEKLSNNRSLIMLLIELGIKMPRYWVGVVSKNHVLEELKGILPGLSWKGWPINRMKKR